MDAVLGAVEDAEAFQAEFDRVFDGLSADSQAAVSAALRSTTVEPAQLLPAQKLNEYAALGSEPAKQIAAWGKDGLRLYTKANAKLNAIIDGLPEADAKRATAYLSGLSPAEKAAVIAGLAR